jgi:Heterokaryon incompatibility protein (HET)
LGVVSPVLLSGIQKIVPEDSSSDALVRTRNDRLRLVAAGTDKPRVASLAHPETDLPRIFQQAIAVTQRLGLRYLWIDTLCISQEDDEEWRETSVGMATIYQNSHVTISAIGAHDVFGDLRDIWPAYDNDHSFKFSDNITGLEPLCSLLEASCEG